MGSSVVAVTVAITGGGGVTVVICSLVVVVLVAGAVAQPASTAVPATKIAPIVRRWRD